MVVGGDRSVSHATATASESRLGWWMRGEKKERHKNPGAAARKAKA